MLHICGNDTREMMHEMRCMVNACDGLMDLCANEILTLKLNCPMRTDF